MSNKPCFRIVVVCLAVFAIQSVLCSQNSKVDSLQATLKSQKEDTNKVNSLNALAALFVNNNPDTSIYFSGKAIALAEKLKFGKGNAEALLYTGIAQTNIGKWSDALASLSRALEISNQRKDDFYAAKVHTNIGNLYTDEGRYPEALSSHFTALKLREALPVEDKKGIASSYTNIGVVYRLLLNYNEALKYYSKALRIKLEIDDKRGIANLYTNIGNLYILQRDYEKALHSYEGALEMFTVLNDKRGIAACYNNIGSVYSNSGRYPEALQYFSDYLEMKIASGDKAGIASAYLNIGNVLIHQKKYKEAEEYFLKAKKLSEQVGSTEYLRDIFSSLSRLDSAVGNFKSAFTNYQLYVQFRDSLNNDENLKMMVQTQMKYVFDKQHIADSIRNAEKKNQDDLKHNHEIQQQKTYTYVGVGGFVLMLIVAVVSFRTFRQKQKANAIISHQKELVEQKQKEILDSIHYARRIQKSLMPTENYIQKSILRIRKKV